MASDSDTKLTKFTSAVTVVTAEFANSIFNEETAVSDVDGDGTTVIYGHVHDGTYADGHASKVHLTGGAHIRGKLGHNNLADDAVQKNNIQTYPYQQLSSAIPVYEGSGSSKQYYIDLSAYEPPGNDKNILFKKVTGGVETVGAEDSLSWDYTNNRLGINTSTPANELHIVGNDTYGASIFMERADSDIASGETLGSVVIAGAETDAGSASEGSPGGGAGIWAYASETFTSIAAGSDLTIFTTPLGTTTRTNRVRVKADGNVGIGSSNPTHKLHVSGTGYFLSDLTVGGSATIAGDLTVNGTTTSLNTTVTTTEDPVIMLGSGTSASSSASAFRGIEFKYYESSAIRTGFFGMDRTNSDTFTYLRSANVSSEVFTGDLGPASFGALGLGIGYAIAAATNTDVSSDVNPYLSHSSTSNNFRLHISNSSAIISTTTADNGYSNSLLFRKSRGTKLGGTGSILGFYPKGSSDTSEKLNIGDKIGQIRFEGMDASNAWLGAAEIVAFAGDNAGPNILPGGLGFLTKGLTAGAPLSERVRINGLGHVAIGLAESGLPDPKRRLDIYHDPTSNTSPIRVNYIPKGGGEMLVWDKTGTSGGLPGDVYESPIPIVVTTSAFTVNPDGASDVAFTINQPDYHTLPNGTAIQVFSGNQQFVYRHGKVGIGFDNPTQKLHIITPNDNEGIKLENVSTGAAFEAKYIAGSNYGYQLKMDDNNNATTVFLRSYGDSYLNSGNLGIGTINPTAKLDVVGVANATTLSIAGTQITATAAQINAVAVTTGGQVEANKAVVTDANKDVDGVRNSLIDGDIHLKTDTKGFKDGSGNYLQKYQKVASAVNHFVVKNAATGNNPIILVEGSDTNIGMTLTPKGTGRITLDGMQWPAADGTNNQVLKTDGSGNLSWTAQSGGGGGVSLSNDANNRLVTADGNNGINGEAGLTYDGSSLLAQDSSIKLQRNSTNNADHSVLTFAKSGNATDGGHTVVQNNEDLGAIEFQASDGTDYGVSALIKAAAEGTPGNNDTPGRLTFHTTSNDSDAAAERMRIDSFGNIGISGCTDPKGALQTHNGDLIIRMNVAGNTPKALSFRTGRGTGVNNKTVVQNNDGLGYVTWSGADGSNDIIAASIQAKVTGSPGSNDMPASLIFSTNHGAAATTERFKVLSTGDLELLSGNEFRWYDSDNSNYVGFKAPALTGNKIWILPPSDGSNGQVLKTDGSGNLSWTNSGGGGSLNNIVEDTSPQLGGSLDVNGQSIVSTSNANITIAPNGSGDTILSNGNLGIGTTNPLHRIHMVGETSNSVQLRMEEHGNFQDGPDIRFYTSRGTESSPVVSQTNDFIGAMNARYWDGSGYEECGYLGWQVGANASQGESIFSIKTNVDGTNAVRIAIDTNGDIALKGGTTVSINEYLAHEGDSDTRLKFLDDQLYIEVGGVPFMKMLEDDNQDMIVFNESSSDIDFRVEGNGDTHAIFVEASSDNVGIGASNPVNKLHVNGNIAVGGSNNELRFYEGANYVGFEAPALAADKIWVLPAADGSNGQVLKTDGSGNLGWVTAGGLSDIVQDSSPQLGGNLDVNNNSLVTASNGNIQLDPNGSGVVIFRGNATKGSGQFKLNCENNSHGVTLKGPPHSAAANYTLTLPNDDGSNGQVLKTDGSGVLSWVSQPASGMTDIIQDTSPQLGGNLDVNNNQIISTGNANITITPGGTGDVQLSADTVQVGDTDVDATITTSGGGDLTLNTNNGNNSGFIKIPDGVNSSIEITPHGSGSVKVTAPLVAKKNVILATSNTTLSTTQSGSICAFDSTTAFAFTLPNATATDVGTHYTFLLKQVPGSNNHEIKTANGSNDNIVGGLIMYKNNTANLFRGAGGSKTKMQFNGSTTGDMDSTVHLVCVGDNTWMCMPATSLVLWTGDNAGDPFAT